VRALTEVRWRVLSIVPARDASSAVTVGRSLCANDHHRSTRFVLWHMGGG